MTDKTYSIVHHRSGEEYIAEFDGASVVRATGPIQHAERDALTIEAAWDWLDNQLSGDTADAAEDLCRWIELGEAWIVRSPLGPNIR